MTRSGKPGTQGDGSSVMHLRRMWTSQRRPLNNLPFVWRERRAKRKTRVGGSGNESRATVIRDGGGGGERTTKRGDGDDSWTAANASGRRSGGGGGGNERVVRELFRRRWPANECVPIAEGQGYLYPCRAAAGSPGPPPERRRRGRTSRARARPMSDAFSVRRDARARDRSFRRLKLRRGRVGAPYKLNSFKRQ